MKILVEGIPAAGREIAFGLAEGWAVAAATRSLDLVPTRLSGTIHLKRASTRGVVVVDASAIAAAPAVCDRCGEACELEVRVDTRLLYSPEDGEGVEYDGLDARADLAVKRAMAPADPNVVEVELTPDDLDVGWYRAGEIDLEEILGEAIALETPPRVVCADVAECDKRTDALLAAARVADGPFAVLSALKRNSPAKG